MGSYVQHHTHGARKRYKLSGGIGTTSQREPRGAQAAKRLIPKLHYSFSSSSLKDKIVLHLSQICASTLGNGAAMAQGL